MRLSVRLPVTRRFQWVRAERKCTSILRFLPVCRRSFGSCSGWVSSGFQSLNAYPKRFILRVYMGATSFQNGFPLFPVPERLSEAVHPPGVHGGHVLSEWFPAVSGS
jgi:hypothetical protein